MSEQAYSDGLLGARSTGASRHCIVQHYGLQLFSYRNENAAAASMSAQRVPSYSTLLCHWAFCFPQLSACCLETNALTGSVNNCEDDMVSCGKPKIHRFI